ncbi:16S rRNA (guanine(527)-N(7))-methyltransferase RsmG [Catalinimonas niigatensis]|uniref:16S rRNA (guanine(527)-N(7))-methyltransferase RsmG n=1 Tax=Catalinimonas niigatensis TaxID=1397264 RepID=UPI002666BF02|nr:16S rRNA (guanine(527)-N(7))-methyltransferase RsmG [Catalinimonas niigatensis]WPP52181.1 16S rRNA (guanine(527)-N(7))-methyltransferase RsmG [Catalinimonas niigatensis]
MFTDTTVQEEFSKIATYFPQLSDQQLEQLEALYAVYNEWNAKINVISRKDIAHIYLHHVLHSLAIAKVTPINPGTDILDIGTGGGFPGIPLAIMFPKTQFYLVDSIGKKIKVVLAIAEALKLKNVRADHLRAEQVKGRFDFVVSRAVAPLKTLHQWSRQKVKAKSQHDLYNGLICLKGGNLDQELNELELNYALYPIEDYFKEDYFKEKSVLYVPL